MLLIKICDRASSKMTGNESRNSFLARKAERCKISQKVKLPCCSMLNEHHIRAVIIGTLPYSLNRICHAPLTGVGSSLLAVTLVCSRFKVLCQMWQTVAHSCWNAHVKKAATSDARNLLKLNSHAQRCASVREITFLISFVTDRVSRHLYCFEDLETWFLAS